MFWVPHPLSAADKGWGFSVLNFDPAACLVGIEILRKECQNQNPYPLQTPQRMGHPPPEAIRYLVEGARSRKVVIALDYRSVGPATLRVLRVFWPETRLGRSPIPGVGLKARARGTFGRSYYEACAFTVSRGGLIEAAKLGRVAGHSREARARPPCRRT